MTAATKRRPAKAAATPKPSTYLCTWCKNAKEVEADPTSSPNSAQWWHSRCHGETCQCEHKSNPAHRHEEIDGESERRREDLRARLAKAQATGAAERARKNAEAASRYADPDSPDDERPPRPVRQARELKRDQRTHRGVCHHCGEPTKGGIFVAGHDAKLKGELKRAAQDGDIDALAEILYREWPQPKDTSDADLNKAARIAGHKNADAWFEGRVVARIS